MRLELLGAASRYSAQSYGDIRLVEHQAQVREALADPAVEVVFDTALTGDGKTLAALLPAWEIPQIGKAMLAYPTNELIRDQARAIGEFQERFGRSGSLGQLYGQSLADYAAGLDAQRADALRSLAQERQMILSNPDIFTLIHRFHYSWAEPVASLAQYWLNTFRYLVFDEFHVFGPAQIAGLLDGMAFIRASQNPNFKTRFLFLSATPNPILVEKLSAAGVGLRQIEGQYRHGPGPDPDYRTILQPVSLEIAAGEGGLEAWVRENLSQIQEFFAQYPGSRGLLIANSLAAARRVSEFLRQSQLAFSVGENTGLTGPALRQESLEQDLVVATSTVDLGVDFRINFLVFESLGAGTFIQRLGRLGRHPGFGAYRAVALVPGFIEEQFGQKFQDGQSLDREQLNRAVSEQIYRPEQEFPAYLKRWGSALSTLRFKRLEANKDHYQTLLERYPAEARNLVGGFPNFAGFKTLQEHKALMREIESFRGFGGLDVWVYDPAGGAITTMSCLRLLAGTDFELLGEAEALELSQRLQIAFYPNPLGIYAQISSFRSEREFVELTFYGQLKALPLNQAVERKGFGLKAHHPEAGKIARALEKRPLATCAADPSRYDVKTLKRRYRLPAFFELHPVSDNTGTVYPVAFGQEALLLDSLLFFQKENSSWIT